MLQFLKKIIFSFFPPKIKKTKYVIPDECKVLENGLCFIEIIRSILDKKSLFLSPFCNQLSEVLFGVGGTLNGRALKKTIQQILGGREMREKEQGVGIT